jgi:hypothetical protein
VRRETGRGGGGTRGGSRLESVDRTRGLKVGLPVPAT